MTEEYDADYCEKLDRTWTNAFVSKRGWVHHHLGTPTDLIDQFAQSIPGTEMLDAGCGWARYVSCFINRGLDYRGIDLSEEAIRYARTSNPALAFEVGNCRTFPYKANSFDGVWSCCTLGTVPKRYTTDILKERRRVLRPGGVLMEITPMPPYCISEEYMDFEDGNPRIYRAYYDLEELLRYVAAVGFEIMDSKVDYETGSQHVLARA